MLLIDDEPKAISVLRDMISSYCPELTIIGEANSLATGKQKIEKYQPDLIFLDIDLPDGYGFNLLNESYSFEFGVVFTTAYSHFATKAFEVAAIHYLLKPIDIAALKEAVSRFLKQNRTNVTDDQVSVLQGAVKNQFNRITVKTPSGLSIYRLDEIYYFSSEDGVTFLFDKRNEPKVVNQSLNHFEELLTARGFYRSHAKHLINLSQVERIVTHGRNGKAILSNRAEVDVSARKRAQMLNIFNDFNTGL